MKFTIEKGLVNSEINTQDTDGQALAEIIAEDFTEFLNTFHSYREPYDDALDAWLHQAYADIKRKKQFFDFKSQPHFSPSSASSDNRELYEKVRKAKRDEQEGDPFQRRWTMIGTAIGDVVQRDLLLSERHFEKFTGTKPRFTVDRTENGNPFFEDFVKTMTIIEHKGKRFSLFGTCDGVLRYVSDDGEILRVGLEIKSKQTTYAQTSFNSMKEPSDSHVKQVVCYSMMYDVDYYIVLYMNASRKSWFMDKAEQEKYPDFRAFGVYVTEEMKQEVLDKFVDVLVAVEKNEPPALDLDKYTFNNFKDAIAESITDDEILDLATQVSRVKASRMPEYKKRTIVEAYEDIIARKERLNG